MFRTLWRYRELILSLVKRELKTKYKSSALGFLWSLCKPLFIMAILFVVFGIIVKLRFPAAYFFVEEDVTATQTNFAVHLIIGVLLWTYFATSLGESTRSILDNGNLIKKVKIPAEVFPVATVLANLVHFLLALAVLLPIMAFMGYRFTWLATTLPLLIALLTVLTAGFAFMLSSTNVFYRDVASITEIVLMAWFYMTPVFYPASVAWDTLQQYHRGFFIAFVMNPMATICILMRRVLFIDGNFERPEIADRSLFKYLIAYLVISVAVYGLGRLIFIRLSPRFADEV